MQRILTAYAVTIVAMAAIDVGWLMTMTSRFYKPRIGAILADSPNLTAAVIFYLLYCAGVVALAVWPALQSGNWVDALWRGAALGLVAYGTYDLTNMATLKAWPLDLTVVDMVWGTILTGGTAAAAAAVTNAFTKG